MFKGRVESVSHEGGLLVSYSGACPALGSVMIDSGETYIGKVDGVIGNLKDSLVHIAHLDRKSNPQAMLGLEITIRTRKSRDKQHSSDGRRDRDNRGERGDRGGRDDNRGDRGGRDNRGGRENRDNRGGNSNHQNRDWDCPKCNNSNFSFRTECNRCGEQKGRGGSNFQRDDRRGRDDRRDNNRRDNRNTHGDNDWDCPKCKNSNFAFRTECNRCGESKGRGDSNFQRNDRRGRDDRRGGNESRGRDDRRGGNDRRGNGNTHGENDWDCRECKNSNFSFRNECNRCGAPKGRGSAPTQKWEGNDRRAGDRNESSQPRAGDWDCPQCGKSNFAKRNDCFGCGRSKRVGGPRNKGHHRKLRDPPKLQSAKYGRGERRNN